MKHPKNQQIFFSAFQQSNILILIFKHTTNIYLSIAYLSLEQMICNITPSVDIKLKEC